MKEKKLLAVGPPDSGKTSWFAPFQGMLTNIDLLFSSEKITAITCLGTLFTKTCIIEKPVNLFALDFNYLVSIFYEFLLKGILEQTIVT